MPTTPPFAASFFNRSSDNPGPPLTARTPSWLSTIGAQLQLVLVRPRDAIKRLDQAQRVLRRLVVNPVAVSAEILDHDVDAGGAGTGVVPAGRLRLPGIDLLPVDAAGDVNVAVHEDRRPRRRRLGE